MNTSTQTLAVTRDLADLIDLTAWDIAPATQAALAAWRTTVLPHASARRALPTVTAEPSYVGLAAAVASLLGVGGLLVHALSAVAAGGA